MDIKITLSVQHAASLMGWKCWVGGKPGKDIMLRNDVKC